jgi:hypothetical protein
MKNGELLTTLFAFILPCAAHAQVTTFNGRSDTVVLNSTDVDTALGYPPANKQGDTFSGPLAASAGISASSGPLAEPLQTFINAGGTTSDNPHNLHSFVINSDNITDTAGPGFVNGVYIQHNFGGTALKGGRQALSVLGQLTAPTSSSNPNRNYAAAMLSMVASSDNGTAQSPQGAFFAMNPSAIALAGTSNILELTGGELNISARSGSSVWYKAGFSIASYPDDAVQGSAFDAALMISGQSGSPVGWRNGVQFSASNGSQPMNTNGTLISTNGASSVTNGIDISSYSYSGAAIRTPGFTVDGSGNVSANTLSLANSSWTPFTPSLTCASGSLGTYTASGRYYVLGKLVFVEQSAKIINNGTCATSLNFSLPPGIVSVAGNIFAGRDTVVSGKMLQGVVNAGSGTVVVVAYDNSYPAVNGSLVVMTGSFERQ